MNNDRRKTIDNLLAQLEEIKGQFDNLKEQVESVRDEEQGYFDNMPESLQGSDKGQMAEEAITNLDDAVNAFDMLDFDDISNGLESAKG